MKINVWVVNWRPNHCLEAACKDTLNFNGMSVEPFTKRSEARNRVKQINKWYKILGVPHGKVHITRNYIVLDA